MEQDPNFRKQQQILRKQTQQWEKKLDKSIKKAQERDYKLRRQTKQHEALPEHFTSLGKVLNETEDINYSNKFFSPAVLEEVAQLEKASYAQGFRKYMEDKWVREQQHQEIKAAERSQTLRDAFVYLDQASLNSPLSQTGEPVVHADNFNLLGNPTTVSFDERYNKPRRNVVHVDSRDRNTEDYPNPNHYIVSLGRQYRNVKSVRMISSEFPNTEQVIRAKFPGNNNHIYWINDEDADQDYDCLIYQVDLDPGNYSASTLINHIQSKVNQINRFSDLTPHEFIVTINLDTDIVTFQSLQSQLLAADPIQTIAGSNILTINQTGHPFVIGESVVVSDARSVGGIPSELINQTHVVTGVTANSYNIVVAGTSTQTETGGGSRVKSGKNKPFKILFSNLDTPASILGFPQQDSSFHISYPIELIDNQPINLTIPPTLPVPTTHSLSTDPVPVRLRSTNHQLKVGDIIEIRNTKTIPSINGTQTVTAIIDENNFEIGEIVKLINDQASFLNTNLGNFIPLDDKNLGAVKNIIEFESSLITTGAAHGLSDGDGIFIAYTSGVVSQLGGINGIQTANVVSATTLRLFNNEITDVNTPSVTGPEEFVRTDDLLSMSVSGLIRCNNGLISAALVSPSPTLVYLIDTSFDIDLNGITAGLLTVNDYNDTIVGDFLEQGAFELTSAIIGSTFPETGTESFIIPKSASALFDAGDSTVVSPANNGFITSANNPAGLLNGTFVFIDNVVPATGLQGHRTVTGNESGTLQAAAAGTATLSTAASPFDDFYNTQFITITNNSPVGVQGQTREITDYDGGTKVATLGAVWTTIPDGTSTYQIISDQFQTTTGITDDTLSGTDQYVSTDFASLRGFNDIIPDNNGLFVSSGHILAASNVLYIENNKTLTPTSYISGSVATTGGIHEVNSTYGSTDVFDTEIIVSSAGYSISFAFVGATTVLVILGHNFLAGETVLIRENTTNAGVNGTHVISSAVAGFTITIPGSFGATGAADGEALVPGNYFRIGYPFAGLTGGSTVTLANFGTMGIAFAGIPPNHSVAGAAGSTIFIVNSPTPSYNGEKDVTGVTPFSITTSEPFVGVSTGDYIKGFDPISSITITGGPTETVTTFDRHNLAINDVVYIRNGSPSAINGFKTVLAVPTLTTYRIALALGGIISPGQWIKVDSPSFSAFVALSDTFDDNGNAMQDNGHPLTTGQRVYINATTTTPDIDDVVHTITRLNSDFFTLDTITLTSATGSAGQYARTTDVAPIAITALSEQTTGQISSSTPHGGVSPGDRVYFEGFDGVTLLSGDTFDKSIQVISAEINATTFEINQTILTGNINGTFVLTDDLALRPITNIRNSSNGTFRTASHGLDDSFTITSFAFGGVGITTITAPGHTFVDGDLVFIRHTTVATMNTTFTIFGTVPAVSFDISFTFIPGSFGIVSSNRLYIANVDASILASFQNTTVQGGRVSGNEQLNEFETNVKVATTFPVTSEVEWVNALSGVVDITRIDKQTEGAFVYDGIPGKPPLIEGDQIFFIESVPIVPSIPNPGATISYINDDDTQFEIVSVPDITDTGFAIETSTVSVNSVITAPGHNYANGDVVIINGHTGSTPSINGTNYTISNVVEGVSFTIPVNVLIPGTGGRVDKVTTVFPFPDSRGIVTTFYKTFSGVLEAIIINSISETNPTLLLATSHGLTIGSTVCIFIQDTNTNPDINGIQMVFVLDSNTLRLEGGVVVTEVLDERIFISESTSKWSQEILTTNAGVPTFINTTHIINTIPDKGLGTTTIVVTPGHTYSNGDAIFIACHPCAVPDINGRHIISDVTATSFKIPIEIIKNFGKGGGSVTKEDEVIIQTLERVNVRPCVLLKVSAVRSGDPGTVAVSGHPFLEGDQITITGMVTFTSFAEPYILGDYIVTSPTTDSVFTITVSAPVALDTRITTSVAHNFVVGDRVVIAGHAGSTPDLNGEHNIIAITSPLTFDIDIESSVGGIAGTATGGATFNIVPVGKYFLIQSSAVSGGSTIVTTQTSHNFLAGDSVTIDGHNSIPNIDGKYTISAVTSTTLTIPVPIATPGTAVGVAKQPVVVTKFFNILSSSISGLFTKITTTIDHTFVVGETIVISGHVSTPDINGSHTITSIPASDEFEFAGVLVVPGGATGRVEFPSTTIGIASQNGFVTGPSNVITSGHGLVTGDTIVLRNVKSTPDINDRPLRVVVLNSTDFQLFEVTPPTTPINITKGERFNSTAVWGSNVINVHYNDHGLIGTEILDPVTLLRRPADDADLMFLYNAEDVGGIKAKRINTHHGEKRNNVLTVNEEKTRHRIIKVDDNNFLIFAHYFPREIDCDGDEIRNDYALERVIGGGFSVCICSRNHNEAEKAAGLKNHGFAAIQTNVECNGLLFRSVSLEGEPYILLTNELLSAIDNTGPVDKIFAKIMLSDPPGSMMYNTFVTNAKVFDDPLSKIEFLEVTVKRHDGTLFDFNGIDHSFSLEIFEYIDRLKHAGVSSRRGIVDRGTISQQGIFESSNTYTDSLLPEYSNQHNTQIDPTSSVQIKRGMAEKPEEGANINRTY